MSPKKRIAIIAGDGIGQEVIPEAVKAIAASGADVELSHFDWGADRYLADSVTVPPGGFAMLERDFDAILVGAFGDPRVASNIHAKEILLGMRFKMDLYANVRPVRLLDAALCPLKGVEPKHIDFVVVRENTEGVYTDAAAYSNRARPTRLQSRKTSTPARAWSELSATRLSTRNAIRNWTELRVSACLCPTSQMP